jgi:hypothetical protein
MPRKSKDDKSLQMKPVSFIEKEVMLLLDSLSAPVTEEYIIGKLTRNAVLGLSEALVDLETRQLISRIVQVKRDGRLHKLVPYYQTHPRRLHNEYYQVPILMKEENASESSG